jgi:hypothetical protein
MPAKLALTPSRVKRACICCSEHMIWPVMRANELAAFQGGGRRWSCERRSDVPAHRTGADNEGSGSSDVSGGLLECDLISGGSRLFQATAIEQPGGQVGKPTNRFLYAVAGGQLRRDLRCIKQQGVDQGGKREGTSAVVHCLATIRATSAAIFSWLREERPMASSAVAALVACGSASRQ